MVTSFEKGTPLNLNRAGIYLKTTTHEPAIDILCNQSVAIEFAKGYVTNEREPLNSLVFGFSLKLSSLTIMAS
jgi:hypothetical protein